MQAISFNFYFCDAYRHCSFCFLAAGTTWGDAYNHISVTGTLRSCIHSYHRAKVSLGFNIGDNGELLCLCPFVFLNFASLALALCFPCRILLCLSPLSLLVSFLSPISYVCDLHVYSHTHLSFRLLSFPYRLYL